MVCVMLDLNVTSLQLENWAWLGPFLRSKDNPGCHSCLLGVYIYKYNKGEHKYFNKNKGFVLKNVDSLKQHT